MQTIYQKRIEDFTEQEQKLLKRYNRLSFVRLLVFIVGVGIGIYAYAIDWRIGLIWTVLFLVGFIAFVVWHQGILRQKIHFTRLRIINENELQYLAGHIEHFETGEEFVDASHPYTVDLDIFGQHSLFQAINRSCTSIGKRRLASYLQIPTSVSNLQQRQQAVGELSALLDWRQNFQAYGTEINDNPQYIASLQDWLQDDFFVLGNRWLRVALYAVPVIMLTVLFIPLAILPFQIKLLFLLLPLLILRQYLKRVNRIHERTAKANDLLERYAKLIGHIEKQSFNTPLLAQLHKTFVSEKGKVSQQLKRLARIIEQLNVRYNIFALPLNLLFLWDLQFTRKLELWKAQQRDALPQWFHALEELDALLSLANLRHNHPTWVFPELHDSTQPIYEGVDVGHPLINPDQCVRNNLEIPTRSHLKLVTGSNMAGKSTFLRSIGLSVVMAMAGAPVCARSLKLPILHIYTSMRTQDALHESTSSFYAELKRLRFILEAIKDGKAVFCLLDEILKGTNSRDRHLGAKALIRQLIRWECPGLVATHDLELAALEQQHPKAIENVCFEVDVDGETLSFDYRLRKGVSQSLNASLLMKQMGIEIEG